MHVRPRARAVFAGLLCLLVIAPSSRAGAADAQAPDAPTHLRIESRADTQLTLIWSAAISYDSPVTGYEVDLSTDDAASWSPASDGPTTDTTMTIPAPAAGHLVWYRVTSESDAGPSHTSATTAQWTKGKATQRFVIRTTSGQSLTDGDIRWSDGYGTWSKYYTLNADGVVDLPNVPTGIDMLVEMTDAYLPNNLTVAKEWSLDFGTTSQTLLVPLPPPMERHKITVLMPNGVPVVNAEINAWYLQGLSSNVERDGYVYGDFNSGVAVGTTGADGTAVVTGWSTQGVDFIPKPKYPWPQQAIDIIYDDGVQHQEAVVLMTGAETTVQLDPMPWITTTTPDPTSLGTTTSMLFAAHKSSAPSSHSRVLPAATNVSGIKVTVQPPAGWSAKRCDRKSTLTGTTDSTGRVRLTVCGSKSGVFTVHSHGAVPTGSVTLRVKHAAPLPPVKVAVRSAARGQLTVSWGRPSYAGGAAVTSYKIMAVDAGQKTRTYVVHGSALTKPLTHTFTGLARAKLWRISVQAISKYGVGDAARGSARVI